MYGLKIMSFGIKRMSNRIDHNLKIKLSPHTQMRCWFLVKCSTTKDSITNRNFPFSQRALISLISKTLNVSSALRQRRIGSGLRQRCLTALRDKGLFAPDSLRQA